MSRCGSSPATKPRRMRSGGADSASCRSDRMTRWAPMLPTARSAGPARPAAGVCGSATKARHASQPTPNKPYRPSGRLHALGCIVCCTGDPPLRHGLHQRGPVDLAGPRGIDRHGIGRLSRQIVVLPQHDCGRPPFRVSATRRVRRPLGVSPRKFASRRPPSATAAKRQVTNLHRPGHCHASPLGRAQAVPTAQPRCKSWRPSHQAACSTKPTGLRLPLR